VYFDAMHHRLPIVGTPVGCVPDVTCHGVGDMVRFGDVDGLATVLTRWLSNPAECQAKGNLGHDLVQKQYNWPTVARRMSTEIRATLAGSSEPVASRSSVESSNAAHSVSPIA
jgi:glycosyltransferase involved in cell wall biosynthesis